MTKIRQFKWQDRDTAAQDMLQVAYYAPYSISLRALYLIGAFRSEKITPELTEIVLDVDTPRSHRTYALYALLDLDNFDPEPVIKSLKNQTIDKQLDRDKRQIALLVLKCLPIEKFDPQLAAILTVNIDDFDRYIEHGWTAGDLIRDDDLLQQTIENNLNALYDEIRHSNSDRVKFLLLTKSFSGRDLNNRDLDTLFPLLDSHIEWLNLRLVLTLFDADIEEAYFWLDEHIEEVYWLMLTYENKRYGLQWILRLLIRWTDLRELVLNSSEEIAAEYDDYVSGNNRLKLLFEEELKQSKAYQLLDELFVPAMEGDKSAYSKILRVAYRHKNILVRALATRFLVKLCETYNVEDALYRLAKANDDWYDSNWIYSPVRTEAINGLGQLSTPKTWQELINAAFFKPDNELDYYLIRAIESVTNVLMGEEPIPENPKARNPPVSRWYRTLIDMEDVDLEV